MASDTILLVVAIFVVIFAAVTLLLFLSNLKLWLMAYISGANIPLVNLIGMIFRKVDRKAIVDAKIMAVQGDLVIDDDPISCNDTAISTKKLESHYLAGGNVRKVIQALLAAKQVNVDLNFPQVCKIDLSGRDVIKEVRRYAGSNGSVP